MGQTSSSAVALSILYPADDPGLPDELSKLRSYIGPEVEILVGGRVAESYADTLKEIGAVHLADLPGLHAKLETLAR